MTTILNTQTGKIGDERDEVIDHPVLGRFMLRVEEGTKELVEGMFKPGLAVDFPDANNKVVLAPEQVDTDAPVEAEPIVDAPAPEPAATPEQEAN